MGDTSPELKGEHSGSPQHSNRTQEKAPNIGEFDVENGEDKSVECNSSQLVVYNPDESNTNQKTNGASTQIVNRASPNQSPLPRNHPSRALMPIGSYTVQCATCFKWRLIPTQAKYEEIREKILQEPFVCDRAREWQPDVTCDDPADIFQDGSRLWAIDKPNISQTPAGWERVLKIRGEGSTKFADVYYVAPSGKRFRSTIEVEKYLLENPEYTSQGVTISQFSFQTPRPLQDNYLRKRPARVMNANGGADVGTSPEPVVVNPLAWAEPSNRQDMLIGESTPPAKKAKKPPRPSPKKLSTSPFYSQPRNYLDSQQESHASPYEQ